MSYASRSENPPVANSAMLRVELSSPRTARRLLPFHWIKVVAICADLVLIPTTSLLTGIAYHLAFLGRPGPIEAFLGVGVLTAINFSAILAARAAYRPQNLINFWKQARETTIVWLFVFLVLSVVAFSFKVTEEYSRGAILAFFTVGWLSIIVWRLIIFRFVTGGLASGGFAEQKSVLIAQQGQVTGTSAIEELKRCGYLPVRTFEFAANSVSSPHASPKI